MNTTDCYYQQSKSHCQKCGRRCRKHNNRRVKNEQRPCHQLKYKRQQCLFPTELPPYPVLIQTNENHSISKNIRSRNSSRKSNTKNVLIDQFIQVQQLHPTSCKTQSDSYNYEMDNEYQRFTNHTMNKENSDTLQRVQQMIYLRENINNLTYREVHFPNEYIILKRLEEKNNLNHQNRFKVDPYFRSLKLQYQTISTLFQNIPITSFTYSKQDPYQSELTVKTSFKRCPLSENQSTSNDILNHSVLPTDRSLPTVIEMNDTITNESLVKQNDNSTSADPTDSPIFIRPYKEYRHQQYSQNAIQSYINIDHLIKTKKQNLIFDSAVIIDVRKCPQVITHQPSIQDNWNHIKPTWSMPLLTNNQQKSSPITIPNQPIYFDRYPRIMDIHQPQRIFFPWPQNSNNTQQQQISTNSIFYHPIYNESFSNVPYETTWFPPKVKESNEYPFLTSNHLSSIQNTTNISSCIHPTSENQNSFNNSDTPLNISTRNTSNQTNNQSIKYTQTINKIKQILNTLQKKLLNKSILQNKIINKEINNSLLSTQISPLKSISTTMTSDSLVTTYSVSSTLPIFNKNISQLSYSKSTINLENEILQIELDSLNNNYYSTRSKSIIKLLNSAKNINSNQQTSEEEKTKKILNSIQSQSRRSISRRITVRYMSPSFMFGLQILLVLCLINRILMYSFFGIVPADILVSIIIDNSQSSTPMSSTLISETGQTAVSMNDEKFHHFLWAFFRLV